MLGRLVKAVRRNHALEHGTVSILLTKLGPGTRLAGRADHPPGGKPLPSVRTMTVWSGVRVSTAWPPASLAMRAAPGVPAEENATVADEGTSTVASLGPPFMATRTSGRQ